jgi:hypothetical protein
MDISKMCFVIYYYSQTCFGHFCGHLHKITQCTDIYTDHNWNHPYYNCILYTTFRNKMSVYVVVNIEYLFCFLAVYSWYTSWYWSKDIYCSEGRLKFCWYSLVGLWYRRNNIACEQCCLYAKRKLRLFDKELYGGLTGESETHLMRLNVS